MNTLNFTKMHGLGNDFVVIDAINQTVQLNPNQLRFIADRHFGIGCDQILLVEKAAAADFRYRIFNADGSEVEQCGNGARCFVQFVHEKGLTQKREINVETLGGPIVLRLEDNDQVTVNMGVPIFDPAQIPFNSDSNAVVQLLDVEGAQIEITAVSMGNPHAVQIGNDIDNAPVAKLGALIERHPQFPQRVNAGFMQIVDRGRIRLRVYERGAGETLACGTGACAAVAAGIARGLLDETVTVVTRGGELTIRWAGGNAPVWMTGPAITVYDGQIDLSNISSIKEQ